MLLSRIITACILIPVVILGVFYLPTSSFSLAIAIILSLAAWEWSVLVGINKIWQRVLYIGLLWWGFAIAELVSTKLVLGISLLWWLLVFYFTLQYPKINKKFFTGWTSCFVSFLVFIPCLAAINSLHRMAPMYVLFILCLIWAADSGAFFIGRSFGKHKLAIKISPKKTIEGLLGGVLFAFIIALIFALITQVPFAKWLWWTGLVLITVLFSVLGDLFESMLKRQVNVKDSGCWVPGHGGILDRIDSLTAAVPMFTLGLLLFMS
jgi:phosphatidate cytidylyltransferase